MKHKSKQQGGNAQLIAWAIRQGQNIYLHLPRGKTDGLGWANLPGAVQLSERAQWQVPYSEENMAYIKACLPLLLLHEPDRHAGHRLGDCSPMPMAAVPAKL
jgi:hypothetical protein